MLSLRVRSLFAGLVFAGAALTTMPGCDDEKVSQTTPSEELKKSESGYNAEIAKNKAAAKETGKK